MVFSRDAFFVTFPYHPDSPAIATCMTMPAGNAGQIQTSNLNEQGWATSHRVKYTHHVDGKTHFSQDGKVFTKVRNVSKRLDSPVPRAWHAFTVYVTGVHTFARPKPKQGSPTFLAPQQLPRSIRVAGFWVPTNTGVNVVHNPVSSSASSEGPIQGYVCAPPSTGIFPPGVVFLQAFEMPSVTRSAEFGLQFTGGFSPNAGDPSKDATVLILAYPATSPEGVPSMDLGR